MKTSIGGRGYIRGPITDSDYLVQDRGFQTACWVWKGRNPQNPTYGKIRDGDGTSSAHLVSYRQFIGEIPAGLQIDHLCRVRRCVNPDHLEAVTPAENVRRSRSARLNIEAARFIREADMSPRALAAHYGVHEETIRYILRGKTWRE